MYTKNDMDERRHLPRKYLIIYSRVFERTLGKLLGYLADLSPEGAMIISEDRLEVDTLMALRFDLPDMNAFDRNSLNLDVRVARCDPDISPGFYNIGFEFQEVKEEQQAIILKMMDMYEFRR
ncbi:MAG: hypothetical protein HFACDABA_02118 [Anaerolineales bacterium]|nr:hypothetical protein [Anaerolineales bacterium]